MVVSMVWILFVFNVCSAGDNCQIFIMYFVKKDILRMNRSFWWISMNSTVIYQWTHELYNFVGKLLKVFLAFKYSILKINEIPNEYCKNQMLKVKWMLEWIVNYQKKSKIYQNFYEILYTDIYKSKFKQTGVCSINTFPAYLINKALYYIVYDIGFFEKCNEIRRSQNLFYYFYKSSSDF